MRKGSRLIVAVASIALAFAFVLPLWRIRLEAPQYPEGIGMRIHVNTIRGATPHDLQNINGLNHYVGMGRIEPASFPELKYMPWILGGLIAVGLLVALSGKRTVLIGWTGVFMLFAAAGLWDFYRWEYNYGHNLRADAAIKIPGLAYQPPLIGSKQLLNFTAHSWPAAGGWIAIAVFLTALGVTLVELKRRTNGRSVGRSRPSTTASRGYGDGNGEGGRGVVSEHIDDDSSRGAGRSATRVDRAAAALRASSPDPGTRGSIDVTQPRATTGSAGAASSDAFDTTRVATRNGAARAHRA